MQVAQPENEHNNSMKWQKGVSGNPGGLPKDADIVSLEHWLRKVEKHLSCKGVSPVERLEWEVKIIGLLLNRSDVPTYRQKRESKQKQETNSLEELENGRSGPRTGDQTGMEDGSPTV